MVNSCFWWCLLALWGSKLYWFIVAYMVAFWKNQDLMYYNNNTIIHQWNSLLVLKIPRSSKLPSLFIVFSFNKIWKVCLQVPVLNKTLHLLLPSFTLLILGFRFVSSVYCKLEKVNNSLGIVGCHAPDFSLLLTLSFILRRSLP